MSQSAQSRPTGQILQHTAVVFAGMASIGLTVAAGTYVVNQIGGPHSVIASGERERAAVPDIDPGRPEARAPVVTTGNWGLAAGYRELPASFEEPVVHPIGDGPPAPAPASVPAWAPPSSERPAAAHSEGLGGRFAVSENAYVDAKLARTQQHSISLTVGTNVPSALRDTPDTGTDEAQSERTSEAVTAFRTDIDVHTGEITVAVNTPQTGHHEMRIERNTGPAPVPDDHPQRIGQDGSPPA